MLDVVDIVVPTHDVMNIFEVITFVCAKMLLTISSLNRNMDDQTIGKTIYRVRWLR